MTATIKHISVHPNFRYACRVGIFDDIDRAARSKRAPKKNAVRYSYTNGVRTPNKD